MTVNFQPLLALSDGSFWARWNFPFAVGSAIAAPAGLGAAVSLSYSYLTTSATEPGFVAFNAGQKSAAELALSAFEAVARITLTEQTTGGQISFGMNTQSGSAGYATYPAYIYEFSNGVILSVTELAQAGDVWLASNVAWTADDFLPGGDGLSALLHELGHAMGLKHPFEGSQQLSANLADEQYTVMAYDSHPHGLFRTVTPTGGGGFQISYSTISPDSLMPLDILALQHLYGANASHNSGDTLYTFDPATPFIRTIWDGGGTDTISLANFTLPSVINLNEGSYSSVRILSDAVPFNFVETHTNLYDGTDNLAIAYGTFIENAIGGTGNDSIIGNALANTLTGGLGNDSLTGGLGFDTAAFSGNKAGYTITRGAGSVTVTGADGTDTLSGIEKLSFADGNTFLGGALADLDGDGKSDLLWRNSTTGQDAIWRGASSASQQTVPTVADLNWKVAALADFNADGKDDIFWRNAANGQNAIGNGGSSANQVPIANVADLNWKIAGVGDFNADGKDDILWRNTANGQNAIWNGANSASQIAVPNVASQLWKVAGIGDFNADGKDDILWRNSANGQNAIWNGASSASQVPIANVADLNWKIAGIADFSGDGKDDILWRNSANGQNAIWNNASSASQTAIANVADLNWTIKGVGDYNADGKADVLWRNAVNGQDAIWNGASSGAQLPIPNVADLNWSIPAQTNTWIDFNGIYAV
jgi:hypothetical protein